MCIKVEKKIQVPFACSLYRCNSNSVSPNTYLTKQCNLLLSFLSNTTINKSNNKFPLWNNKKNIKSKNIFFTLQNTRAGPTFFNGTRLLRDLMLAFLVKKAPTMSSGSHMTLMENMGPTWMIAHESLNVLSYHHHHHIKMIRLKLNFTHVFWYLGKCQLSLRFFEIDQLGL